MAEGFGLGEGLCWVECRGFEASLNNDAKREYIIHQCGRLFLQRLDRNCPPWPLLQLSPKAVVHSF